MRPLALTLALMMGCATAAPEHKNLISVERSVEVKPLPPDPALEPLPPGTPVGDWVEAQEAGTCLDKAGKAVPGVAGPCPVRAGLVESEARGARDALFRIRYPELRKTYEADRAVWAAQRELYEERLKTAEEELKKAQPGWWQQHGPAVGMVGGFIVGAVLTVSLTFALHQATK